MKHFRLFGLIACLFLALFIISEISSEEISPVELLKKAYENQRLVTHKGVINTIIFDNTLMTPDEIGPGRPEGRMRNIPPENKNQVKKAVVRIFQKDGKMRMDYRAGSVVGLSIIDDGKKMIHINHTNKTVIIRPIPFSQGDISLLLSNYEVIPKGREKIAERATRIIQLKSRYTGNPSKKLWIDIETFMPLKREHYNSDGILTTRSFYKEIDYDAKLKDSDFSPPKQWRLIKEPQNMQKFPKAEIAEFVDFDIIEPKYIPAGYVLDGFYRFHPPPPRRGKGVHIRYIDGINSISCFEILPPHARQGVGGRMRGFFRRHRMRERGRHGSPNPDCKVLGNRQGKAVRITKDGLNIIIAGDIAETELYKIANSFDEEG